MKKILVGTAARRDKDGNFLPSQPIFREVPDDTPTEQALPIDDITPS